MFRIARYHACEAALPSEQRTAGDLLLELVDLFSELLVLEAFATDPRSRTCCCGVPAEVGLLGPDTRR